MPNQSTLTVISKWSRESGLGAYRPLSGWPMSGAKTQTFAAPAKSGTRPTTDNTSHPPPRATPTTTSTAPATTRSSRPAPDDMNLTKLMIPPFSGQTVGLSSRRRTDPVRVFTIYPWGYIVNTAQTTGRIVSRTAWGKRYGVPALVWKAEPDQFLLQEVRDLHPGQALDVGCGKARNAARLAQQD